MSTLLFALYRITRSPGCIYRTRMHVRIYGAEFDKLFVYCPLCSLPHSGSGSKQIKIFCLCIPCYHYKNEKSLIFFKFLFVARSLVSIKIAETIATTGIQRAEFLLTDPANLRNCLIIRFAIPVSIVVSLHQSIRQTFFHMFSSSSVSHLSET